VVASIKAPFAFLQEPIKILLFDAVKFPYVPFGLVPKILDPVDVVDTHVMKIRDIQRVVRPEGICVNNAVRPDLFLDNRQ